MKNIKYIQASDYAQCIMSLIKEIGINDSTRILLYSSQQELLKTVVKNLCENFVLIVEINDSFANYAPIVYSSQEFEAERYTAILLIEDAKASLRIKDDYTGMIFIVQLKQQDSIVQTESNDKMNDRENRDRNSYSSSNNNRYNKDYSSKYNSSNSFVDAGSRRSANNYKERETLTSRYSFSYFILKPICYKENKVWDILKDISSRGITVSFFVRKKYPKDVWEQLYAEHRSKPHFNEMCEYLSKNHVCFVSVMCEVEALGEDKTIIDKMVRIIGNQADPSKCEADSIRSKYASPLTTIEYNNTHRPDSMAAYEREYFILMGKKPIK